MFKVLLVCVVLSGCGKSYPHMVRNYGCNVWIMDYGNGDVFLNTTPEGDGRMFHNVKAAIKAADRLLTFATCDHNYMGPK